MKVINYKLYWDMTHNSGGIHLRLENSTVVTLTADDPGKLVVWVDMLRNDVPVFYWKTGTKEGLASDWEQVKGMGSDSQDRFQQDGQA